MRHDEALCAIVIQVGGWGDGVPEKFRITVDLEIDEYQKLKQLKILKDRSFAWLGRQAICEYIKSHHNSIQETTQDESKLKKKMTAV